MESEGWAIEGVVSRSLGWRVSMEALACKF